MEGGRRGGEEGERGKKDSCGGAGGWMDGGREGLFYDILFFWGGGERAGGKGGKRVGYGGRMRGGGERWGDRGGKKKRGKAVRKGRREKKGEQGKKSPTPPLFASPNSFPIHPTYPLP